MYHDTGKWGIPGSKGMEVGPDTWALAGATMHNVMVRIPGTSSSGAVVLAPLLGRKPHAGQLAGVPVIVKLADVSQGLPLEAGQRAAFGASLRSGYGGGHGIDSMTLIHRKYRIP